MSLILLIFVMNLCCIERSIFGEKCDSSAVDRRLDADSLANEFTNISCNEKRAGGNRNEFDFGMIIFSNVVDELF